VASLQIGGKFAGRRRHTNSTDRPRGRDNEFAMNYSL
jgi:hypothetical protein